MVAGQAAHGCTPSPKHGPAPKCPNVQSQDAQFTPKSSRLLILTVRQVSNKKHFDKKAMGDGLFQLKERIFYVEEEYENDARNSSSRVQASSLVPPINLKPLDQSVRTFFSETVRR